MVLLVFRREFFKPLPESLLLQTGHCQVLFEPFDESQRDGIGIDFQFHQAIIDDLRVYLDFTETEPLLKG
ncbi:hypothetical protein SDC9_185953 [bioreactor metagenome]|uniref:Uncharacterized protein n=1 Tax=bioreactor metagenome TaxID=1076179 RepID=A0A645HJR1_9ZZZZ